MDDTIIPHVSNKKTKAQEVQCHEMVNGKAKVQTQQFVPLTAHS